MHTCHKLWTEFCEINQNFKGDLIKFCEIFTKITLEFPQNNPKFCEIWKSLEGPNSVRFYLTVWVMACMLRLYSCSAEWWLTLKFPCFFVVCCFLLLFFFKINFSKKFFSGIPSACQTILDPDQARHYVWPNLNPNCLHLGYQQRTLVGRVKFNISNNFIELCVYMFITVHPAMSADLNFFFNIFSLIYCVSQQYRNLFPLKWFYCHGNLAEFIGKISIFGVEISIIINYQSRLFNYLHAG